MVEMSEEEFEELVADALDEIPEAFLERLYNVVFLVEDEPDGDEEDLLGVYDGFAQTDGDFEFAEPNRIIIFRGPTLRMCDSPQEVAEEVRVTVFHEVAHHFGIEDDELHELGWA
ncbi:putative Zn-dependent protease with MMP-like domain [Arcanobacterium wilhelmae]|uniref:Zn-dependent protease with MMP-like domain n=1 Tax=Arcanobacterium wilhelmae TaxID=1803177 RepID=A0ABT9NDD7_9ACTO|nr:metallopeptidase family protein [Arcanobacterium wilhelmae]MDP9801201.1 putative Zn-dependent protease with MMP-like domain [Arcanobacterium wilhelmae]WFN90552.1 metallopeptidase family protein [Arcanobacterium wilhelmae]